MADHIRRSARDEKPRNSGAVMIAVAASVAAVIAGVVFLSTYVNPSNQATQQEQTAATDDSANAKSDEKDASASDDEKAKDKDADDKSDDKTDDKSDDKSDDKTDDKDSQSDSAPMGNAYTNGENNDSKDEGESGSASDSGSQEGSSSSSSSSGDSGSSSSSSGSSSASGSSGSSGSSSSYSAPTAAYTSADGWIQAEACATCVAEVGTITASEIPFDDDIPQVGLDTASYPYEHFGKYVEVKYGDTTVTAMVVDCGAYNGGTSGIVLNPAVFYEFGAWDADDWGRREVSYRFV